MAIPRVAIVGRPNVGKSSLMNMLAKAKVSIVDPTPGVTRDRVSTVIELDGPLLTEPPKLAEIIDTGGYGVYTAEGSRFDDAGADLQQLTGAIEHQIAAAVDQADLILFVIDAQAGITSLDETIAQLLRERAFGKKGQANIPVIVVANKVDADKWEPYGLEAAAFGFGEPWLVSAMSNFKRRAFTEALYAALPEAGADDLEQSRPEMRVALVGARNAGKSSFVNALAGEERCIVSEIAGTTRDAIDVQIELEGRRLVLIDTAGVRKRSKFADAVEHWAFHRSQLAIQRADVVLLLIDATRDLTGIEKRLGGQIQEAFRPCVITVTKWDLTAGRKNRKGQPISVEDYRQYIEKEMPGLSHCPIVFTSSVESLGLTEAIHVAFELYEQSLQRISTGQLNKFFKQILSDRGPSTRLGSVAKIYYVTQVATQPPTLVLVVNDPNLFKPEYQRYLMNRIREELPFEEVPVRLIFRERKRAELGDLLSGEHRRSQSERSARESSDDEDPEAIERMMREIEADS